MVSLVNSSKHLRERRVTNYQQSPSEDTSRENVFELILQSQHEPDTQTKHTNSSAEHRGKRKNNLSKLLTNTSKIQQSMKKKKRIKHLSQV